MLPEFKKYNNYFLALKKLKQHVHVHCACTKIDAFQNFVITMGDKQQTNLPTFDATFDVYHALVTNPLLTHYTRLD